MRHAAAACAISTRTGRRTTPGRATTTQKRADELSVRGHEVFTGTYFYQFTSYQKSFLAPIGPTVSNRAASCATLQRQRSLSSVLTQARLFLSRLVIPGLLSLGYTNSNCSCCLHAPPANYSAGFAAAAFFLKADNAPIVAIAVPAASCTFSAGFGGGRLD